MTVIPLPGLTITEDKTVATGEVVTLSSVLGNNESTVTWYNQNTGEVICNDCPEVPVQPLSSTTYRAVASNSIGCEEEQIVELSIQGDCEVDRIVATNAFTPNEDGSNDYFEIQNGGTAEIESVQIFNRWGEMVFETGNINDQWDGTFRGIPVNPGVFMYVMRVLCIGGDQFTLVGNVTVLR